MTAAVTLNKNKRAGSGEDLYQASQWKLMMWKLRRHRLAVTGGIVLILFYLMAIFAPLIAPYNGDTRSEYTYHPPQAVHWVNQERF